MNFTKNKSVTNNGLRAGARKSIFHPNEIDISVLDAMLRYAPSTESPKLQMDWISKETGVEKVDVQRSIKWLNQARYIETQGRGRGTHYEVLATSNDLTLVDPSGLGDNYRQAGGPTVKEICRTVFNGLEPACRVSPAKVTKIAQTLFPGSKLTRQSFGQVFTKMAAAGELLFEGEGRSRQYWRGMDLLEGAAETSEVFDFSSLFSDDSTEEAVEDSDEDSEDGSDEEAIAS